VKLIDNEDGQFSQEKKGEGILFWKRPGVLKTDNGVLVQQKAPPKRKINHRKQRMWGENGPSQQQKVKNRGNPEKRKRRRDQLGEEKKTHPD